MSAEEHPVEYLALEALEDEFEDVEVEILRKQHELTKDLYVKRQAVIDKIPGFWPLVIEQSPPEIDEYIQPTDAALFMTSLTNLHVERHELPNGDPRSVRITFTFSENDHFENTTLTKEFNWRNAKDGSSGYVSVPVEIKWKEGKDLTNGMLDLVSKVYKEDAADSENKKKLKELIEETGLDGLSFFSWFGYHGAKISDAEHQEATKKLDEVRAMRKAGKAPEEPDMDEDDDEDEDWEICPGADDVAVCIAEDLWPGAIKYFMNAQDGDSFSDMEFEDASDEEMEE
jgi:hypothetical protein